MIKNISILGSTGSVGTSTIEFIRLHPDRFKVVGLAAGFNVDVLVSQIREFSPELVSVSSESDAKKIKELLSYPTEIVFGPEGCQQLAELDSADIVVSAIVGAAGLIPTLSAIKKKKIIALANKESMVIAGELMRRTPATILPVDSEHSALFQCMEGNQRENIERLILTASGGPFRTRPNDTFETITPREALNHPNWTMGPKITIDCATMMNKGLEVMEARWLFQMPPEKIDVCIHPQSIVHSMVEYIDGSIMAHLGVPDMKVPIAYALSYPERLTTGAARLNLFEKKLEFFEPDTEKFPCLRLAFEVARKNGTCPAVLNAANEIAVDGFLKERLRFTDISKIIEKTLEAHSAKDLTCVEDVLEADRWAREKATELEQSL